MRRPSCRLDALLLFPYRALFDESLFTTVVAPAGASLVVPVPFFCEYVHSPTGPWQRRRIVSRVKTSDV
jgi:hypothetical protein